MSDYFHESMVAKMVSSNEYQEGYSVGFASGYNQCKADVIDEITKSLKEVGYEYDNNMSVDNNIGSALLGEFSKGYIEGNKDRN